MNPRFRSNAAIAAFSLGWAFPALAQDPVAAEDFGPTVRISGTVVDGDTREPAPSVQVVFHRIGHEGEPAWSGFSNRDGRFATPPIPSGAYQIEVTGVAYEPLSAIEVYPIGGIIDLRMELAPRNVAYELRPIVVSVRRQTRLERAGFYERESQGIGRYINYEQIQARRPRVVTDLFYDVPGVRVTPSAGVTTSSIVRLRGDCIPQYVLDGTPMIPPVPIDALVPATDLEAIEVYTGSTAPIEYAGGSPCGTIMVWTRSPPQAIGSTISLKKFAVVVGFAALAVAATSR